LFNKIIIFILDPISEDSDTSFSIDVTTEVAGLVDQQQEDHQNKSNCFATNNYSAERQAEISQILAGFGMDCPHSSTKINELSDLAVSQKSIYHQTGKTILKSLG